MITKFSEFAAFRAEQEGGWKGGEPGRRERAGGRPAPRWVRNPERKRLPGRWTRKQRVDGVVLISALKLGELHPRAPGAGGGGEAEPRGQTAHLGEKEGGLAGRGSSQSGSLGGPRQRGATRTSSSGGQQAPALWREGPGRWSPAKAEARSVPQPPGRPQAASRLSRVVLQPHTGPQGRFARKGR